MFTGCLKEDGIEAMLALGGRSLDGATVSTGFVPIKSDLYLGEV